MSGPRATEPAARAASRSGSLHVVELVGTAGAGKTSLLEALANSGVTIRAGFRLRKHWHVLPAFALVPTFVALHRPFRGVLWKEMKRITYLATLRHRLQEQRKGSRPVVLDEGPVYMLARLRVLGGNPTERSRIRPLVARDHSAVGPQPGPYRLARRVRSGAAGPGSQPRSVARSQAAGRSSRRCFHGTLPRRLQRGDWGTCRSAWP